MEEHQMTLIDKTKAHDNDLIRRGDALEAVAGWEIPSTAIAALPAVTVGVKPCGGCGNDDPLKRCIGCFHDFGTPDSAWVHRYAPLAALDLTPAPRRYMGQIMAECDCPREAECQAAGRCIAEGRR